MIEDVFIINPVIHPYNMAPSNYASEDGRHLAEGFYGIHTHWNPPGQTVPKALLVNDLSMETLTRMTFLESNADMAGMMYLRLDSWFKDGMCSWAKTVEAGTRWPQRFFTYYGVDPTRGLQAAIDDLHRQHDELPTAIGLKLYPHQINPFQTFRMDDPSIFRLYEEAAKLGVKTVAVHKALPNGPVPMGPYKVDDVEGAAIAFPHLAFEIVHAGMAFVQETAQAIGRFPNVYANLEVTAFLQWKAPGLWNDVMAEFLFWGGPEKIIYSDGAPVCPTEPLLQNFWRWQLPEAHQQKYRLPALTREDKALMLGKNYARIVGLDIEAAKAKIADDEFARERKANGGLLPPYTIWREEGRAHGIVDDANGTATSEPSGARLLAGMATASPAPPVDPGEAASSGGWA